MRPLERRIAVVAGASRGGGRGIARALGEAGATVIACGRSARGGPPPVDGAPGTVEDTAEEVTRAGGLGVPARVDFTDEAEVARLFERVVAERGAVDVLACAVWGGNERWNPDDWRKPFWEQPLSWAATMEAGPRAALLAARAAAAPMAARGDGLIALVTDGVNADGARPYAGHLGWDLGHACMERLAIAMHHDLAPRGVTVVALMPGFMRTERVERHLTSEEQRRAFRYYESETPLYLGRAVAALAADARRLRFGGTVQFVADLARAYGFTDADGKQPPRFDFTAA